LADILIACVDGLKGFPDAIEAVFPKAAVQLCLVHMVRHSLNFVGWKQRKEVAADLRLIYSAATEDEALLRLTEFEGKWDASFAPIGQPWRRNWTRLRPFFDYPADIRKVIYTANAIESVNMSLRKITKTRGSFPTDEAVFKLFYLALNNISQKWTMPIRDWKATLNRFTIQFDERMPRVKLNRRLHKIRTISFRYRVTRLSATYLWNLNAVNRDEKSFCRISASRPSKVAIAMGNPKCRVVELICSGHGIVLLDNPAAPYSPRAWPQCQRAVFLLQNGRKTCKCRSEPIAFKRQAIHPVGLTCPKR
jgi:Transposase, Mutator family